MAKQNTIQTNFTAGEISPFLHGRIDITKYTNGAERLRNFIVRPQGGLCARPGTLFLTEVKTSAKKPVLLPFEFSDSVGYVLEFGENYVRWLYADAYCVNISDVPLEIATPYLEADLPYLQTAQSGDVMYIVHPKYAPRKLKRISDGGVSGIKYSNFSLETVTFSDGPYLPTEDTDTELRINPSGLPTEITTAIITSTAADFVLADVGKFVQFSRNGEVKLGKITTYYNANSVEVTVLSNIIPEVDPAAKLTYSAPNLTSTLAIFSRANVGAYIRDKENDRWFKVNSYTSTTSLNVTAPIAKVATTGVVTATTLQTFTALLSNLDVFTANDVGRLVRLDLDGKQVAGKITLFTNAKAVTVTWETSIPLDPNDPTSLAADGKTNRWRLGAWSATTGYPSAVAFHEERLVFAASPNEPQTIWMSVSGDYENFAPTDEDSKVLDDSAITATLASGKINAIKWLMSGSTLIVGTLGAPWQIRASSLNEAITPTNLTAQPQGSTGASFITPVRIGSSVLFVQRAGKKLRELYYSYEVDGLVDRDASIISDHIFRNGDRALQMAYQEDPHNVLWFVLSNGQLAGLTYVKDQEVYAWHLHEIGGSTSTTSYGVVESVCSVASPAGDGDRLYLVVRRTINGTTKRYIERFAVEPNYTSSIDKKTMVYLDSAKIYDAGVGVTTTTPSGYAHLNTLTVGALSDGSVQPDGSITAGAVVLQRAARIHVVGLKYQSVLRTLTPEAGAKFGTSQGKQKRIISVVARVLSSLGFKYGTKADSLTQYNFRNTLDSMDSSPDIKSTDVELQVNSDTVLTPQIVIVRDQPYPLNILAIMAEVQTND